MEDHQIEEALSLDLERCAGDTLRISVMTAEGTQALATSPDAAIGTSIRGLLNLSPERKVQMFLGSQELDEASTFAEEAIETRARVQVTMSAYGGPRGNFRKFTYAHECIHTLFVKIDEEGDVQITYTLGGNWPPPNHHVVEINGNLSDWPDGRLQVTSCEMTTPSGPYGPQPNSLPGPGDMNPGITVMSPQDEVPGIILEGLSASVPVISFPERGLRQLRLAPQQTKPDWWLMNDVSA